MPFVMDKFKSKKGASVSEEFALSRIYVQNKAFLSIIRSKSVPT